MAPLVHPPRFARRRDCGRRPRCKPVRPGTRIAMADDRESSVSTWDIMGYHGTTWASMQQPRATAPAASPVGNCSLTVPELKEWLTLRLPLGGQVPERDPNQLNETGDGPV